MWSPGAIAHRKDECRVIGGFQGVTDITCAHARNKFAWVKISILIITVHT